jgi:hypothetical protein
MTAASPAAWRAAVSVASSAAAPAACAATGVATAAAASTSSAVRAARVHGCDDHLRGIQQPGLPPVRHSGQRVLPRATSATAASSATATTSVSLAAAQPAVLPEPRLQHGRLLRWSHWRRQCVAAGWCARSPGARYGGMCMGGKCSTAACRARPAATGDSVRCESHLRRPAGLCRSAAAGQAILPE